jgi:hypothetical protein
LDWVVIYFEKEGYENQFTVVTEYKGPLAGRRVIRGLENECQAYYSIHSNSRLRHIWITPCENDPALHNSV